MERRRTGNPAWLLLDSNVWIALAESEPSLLEALRVAVDRQAVTVYITHVQHDELHAVADESKQAARKLAVDFLGAVDVATSIFVLAGDDPGDPSIDTLAGHPWGSRLGMAALSDDGAAQRFAQYVNRKAGHRPARLRDGVLLETALANAFCFVTEDTKHSGRMRRFYPGRQIERLEWLRALVAPGDHVTFTDAD